MEKGFIKLNRKSFAHKFWTKARVLSEFEAWIDLIQSARYDEAVKIEYIDGREIKYGRGQYPASIRFLAKRWTWGEQKVRTFLNELKKDGSITTDSLQGMNVITLCKYEKYNSGEYIENTANNTPDNIDMSLILKELQELKTQVTTQQITQSQHSGNTNSNKEKKEKKKKKELVFELETWRTDFQIYLDEVSTAFNMLLHDSDFISERERFHPNIDIPLSLEKSFKDYWCTEKAWKKRKATKSEELDWRSTFRNALDQKFNQVYKQKGGSNEQSTNQISRGGNYSGGKSTNDKAASRTNLERLADSVLEQYST